MPKRYVLLVEADDEDENIIAQEDVLDHINIRDLRTYDMSDHEQCAIQFVRELVLQGRPPDPERAILIVIGGDSTVTRLEGTDAMNVERVPFTVWMPVAPEQPMWRAKKIW